MLFQLIVYILIPSFLAFYFWGKKKLNFLQERGFPCLEPSFPMGSMSGIGRTAHFVDIQKNIYDAFKKRDKVAGFYSMLRPTVLLIDLDLIKNILIKDFNNFTDRAVYHNKEGDPLSAHMFALEGAEWKFVRNKLSPTFTTGKIKSMFGTVVGTSEELIKVIDSGKKYEIHDLCNRYICDVIGSVAFGLDNQALKSEKCEILEAGERIFRMNALETMKFFFINSFVDFAKKINMSFIPKEVSDLFMDTFSQAVKYREDNKIIRPDFLNSLIQLKNTGTIDGQKIDDGKKLTFNEIASEAFLFFFAGFETSSTTMSFALYELAANPDVQEKLRDEVLKVIEKHDGKFTYESIFEMSYLNQVFNETLRKYSTVGALIRVTKDDYKIPDSKLVIPGGTQLWVPVYAIHNDEDIYPNPSKFDPDRFTPEEVSKRHNLSFIPFGEGPRNCIGMRFAQLQTKYGIAKLIKEYVLTVNSKMENPPRFKKSSTSMEFEGGIWLDFKKISVE